jgi:hypothetical protein
MIRAPRTRRAFERAAPRVRHGDQLSIPSAEADATPRKSWLDRLLGLAADVRPGEAATALLLATNIFVLLTAYYIIRPVREALLLSAPGGAEIKSYLGAILAASFLVIVPAYGRLRQPGQPHPPDQRVAPLLRLEPRDLLPARAGPGCTWASPSSSGSGSST